MARAIVWFSEQAIETTSQLDSKEGEEASNEAVSQHVANDEQGFDFEKRKKKREKDMI